jgi:CDP-glycerol glycerophosphotransferase (TagB/SpsB family)
LLADVSSISYDWLMFDRPMIFLDHPGLSIPAEKALFHVGRVVKDPGELPRVLKQELDGPDVLGPARRAALAQRFFGLDGRAAERALEVTLRWWRERWSG